MRLSYILLVVAAAFAATLDTAAASGVALSKLNTVNGMDSKPAVESTGRFLRAYKEKYEEDELDDDEDEDNVQEDRMFKWFKGQANAINALQKVLGEKSDDMAEAVMKLSKSEVDDVFVHGGPALAKVIPGYHSDLEPNKFGDLVKASSLSTHDQQILLLGYSRYMQLNNL
ncbi:hypothetical protein P3T76_009104 [Phytophthora citrophthora]|uniref:RxLR effector protein n=1 Tax=Phytophthora citrophthora TaxID=4793 RepID=A0AAD9GI71_9STRA|nr:hypothetical protein P3T76_009100 [Phytophthora citrophthora]KAK1939029.1 hypothetical protein P3T76_009104 [Phytophthora citrophthora]